LVNTIIATVISIFYYYVFSFRALRFVPVPHLGFAPGPHWKTSVPQTSCFVPLRSKFLAMPLLPSRVLGGKIKKFDAFLLKMYFWHLGVTAPLPLSKPMTVVSVISTLL